MGETLHKKFFFEWPVTWSYYLFPSLYILCIYKIKYKNVEKEEKK